jgi:hypothetical protein
LIGDALFATLPSLEVGHGDYLETEIPERLHLSSKLRSPDLHLGLRLGFGKIVIAENRDANAIVDHLWRLSDDN